jgi:hypothetical protein
VTSALEQRIAAIEDREAIADLIHRHAEHIRSGTIHQAGCLLAPDAVFEMGQIDADGTVSIQERVEGAEAILGSKDVIAGQGVRLCPMIHNIRIAVDGDTATSTCVSMTTIWPMGNNFIGEYRDSFRRDDGVWRFATRAFIGFGALDGTSPEVAHARYQAAKEERAGVAPG